MIVPTSTGSAPSTSPRPQVPQIPEAYLLMAAAQMHREGRLVQSLYGEPSTTGGATPSDTKPPPEEYVPSNGDRHDGPSMMT